MAKEVRGRDEAEQKFIEHNEEIKNLQKLIDENQQQTEQLHKETCEIVTQDQLPEELPPRPVLFY